MKQEKSANSKFCELELKYKKHPRYTSITDLPKITKSCEAVKLIIEEIPEIIGSAQEMFIVVLLNRSNRVLVVQKLFVGGISATIVDLKLILKIALSFGASGIMLCHNHPSGELRPSQHDINITQKIKIGCQSIEIVLVDHVIICEQNAYYSFADEGML